MEAPISTDAKWYQDPEQLKAYKRKWYANNKERHRAKNKEWIKNHPEEYKMWLKRYLESHKEHLQELKRKWKLKHPSKEWLDKNPEYGKMTAKRYRGNHPNYNAIYKKSHRSKLQRQWLSRSQKEKLSALQIISGQEIPTCRNCGCADLRILEKEHKNGGGTKEMRIRNSGEISRDIIKGIRKTDDLEVLCKVCNAKAFVERVFNVKFKVECLGGEIA